MGSTMGFLDVSYRAEKSSSKSSFQVTARPRDHQPHSLVMNPMEMTQQVLEKLVYKPQTMCSYKYLSIQSYWRYKLTKPK